MQTINVVVYIKSKSGYSSNIVVDACRQKITQYVNSLRVGENMISAKLGNMLYSIDGVENYKVMTPAEDTSISGTSKLKIGTLTVSDVL